MKREPGKVASFANASVMAWLVLRTADARERALLRLNARRAPSSSFLAKALLKSASAERAANVMARFCSCNAFSSANSLSRRALSLAAASSFNFCSSARPLLLGLQSVVGGLLCLLLLCLDFLVEGEDAVLQFRLYRRALLACIRRRNFGLCQGVEAFRGFALQLNLLSEVGPPFVLGCGRSRRRWPCRLPPLFATLQGAPRCSTFGRRVGA